MAIATLRITKARNDRYRLVFKSARGRIVCEVSPGASRHGAGEAEARAAALKTAKSLARAFHESILER